MKKATLILRYLIVYLLFIESGLMLQAQDISTSKIYADKNKSFVTYYMSHPLHEWDGTSKNLSSVILYNKNTGNINNAAVLIKISSFDSQNSNRDSHMIEVTEAIKYPQVTFISSAITIKDTTIQINGVLTFHGISQNISFPASLIKHNNQLIVSGTFEIKMTDYKIEPPALMGWSCKDWIKLLFKLYYQIP